MTNTQNAITRLLCHASLNQAMQKRGFTMIRFMDDFIILTKTHHPLRRAIKDVYTVLKTSGLSIAKAKTFIDPIACVSRIEGTLTHWMRWLKAGLKGRIESSLKSLILTIHNIQKQIKVARLNRLSVDQAAILIRA